MEQDILKFFKIVCDGIRGEYEKGWSHRNFERDVETLKKLLRGNEICCECGESVRFGSGKFINRVPSISDVKERKEMGFPYPEGEFICAECDLKGGE